MQSPPQITEKEKGGKLGLAAGKAVDALHLYSVAFRYYKHITLPM